VAFLETERLVFRSHEPADEERFVAMQTDPRVRRFVGGSPWTEERARTRFASEYLGRPTSHDGLWATVLKGEDAYIGHCGVCAREEPTEVRLAYYIAQPYWNRGYATEASRGFIELAFQRLGFARVVADIEVGNLASLRVLEKLGFMFHSSEELPGRVLHEYELTIGRWRADTLASL
jgi:RimJ/RimL family protein N-acetyltransferase